MYVPNYIPPPLEVPRNVTQEKYLIRVRFIRRVSVLHLASVLLLGGLSVWLIASRRTAGSVQYEPAKYVFGWPST